MKIWYVLPVFPVLSETFVTTELAALRSLGHELAVHTYAPPPAGAGRLLAERGLADLPVSHGTRRAHLAGLAATARRPAVLLGLLGYALCSSWRRPRQLLASLAWVPRSIGIWRDTLRGRPDVVHLFWGHYPSLLGKLVLDRAPQVALTTSLGAYDFTMGYGGSAPVARRAGMVRTYAAVNVPDLLSMGVDERRIVLEFHGIDLSLLPDPPPAQVPGRLVTAGRLIPEKGMDDVLRTFARVLAVRPDATLRVFGEGPDRGRLERLAGELGLAGAVDFAGHVSHALVFAELSKAEVLLFLTRHEAERLPNVVKEAMACECTCVVARSPGIEELMPGREHGFLVEPGDVEGAAEAVLAVLGEDAASRRRRVELARRHVVERFDPRAIGLRLADRWAALAMEAVQRRGGVDAR